LLLAADDETLPVAGGLFAVGVCAESDIAPAYDLVAIPPGQLTQAIMSRKRNSAGKPVKKQVTAL
jgi:hypothetical protein